jgi:hypothetical protein
MEIATGIVKFALASIMAKIILILVAPNDTEYVLPWA